MLTITEAAKHLKVRRQRIWQLIREGRMMATKITFGMNPHGFYYLINEEELKKWKRVRAKKRTFLIKL